jgi:hypothetical protein
MSEPRAKEDEKPPPARKKRLTRQERWDRDLQCVRLRRQHIEWDTIVEQLGYSSTGHAHDRWMAMLKAYPKTDVELARQQESDRLDMAARALIVRVRKGEMRAIEAYLNISKRRARLEGLDVERVDENMGGAAVDGWLRHVMGASAQTDSEVS